MNEEILKAFERPRVAEFLQSTCDVLTAIRDSNSKVEPFTIDDMSQQE